MLFSDAAVYGMCSNYKIIQAKRLTWNEAKKSCVRDHDASLVSMESSQEWYFFKRNVTLKKDTHWYIGLKNTNFSKSWCWLSSTDSCTNHNFSTSPARSWRWKSGEPNHAKTEHCTEMQWDGLYNNLPCDDEQYKGYICENTIGKELKNVVKKYKMVKFKS